MASIDNQVLDDQFIGDGDVSFTGGQYSAAQEASVPKGAFFRAQNMDFDQFGRLTTRRGTVLTTGNSEARNWEAIATNWNALTSYWGSTLGTQVLDGCFYFDTYASEVIVVAQGGTLLQGTEAAVYGAIASSSYSGSRVYFAQLNDRLYYCDGVGALKYVDSGFAHNSITAGKVTSITITHAGLNYVAVPAATFSSGAATATAVLGYGGRVVGATVTAAGAGYSATTPPTITFAASPATGTTAMGRVNISQVPSKPAFLTSHRNRLFCTSADTAIPPDTIYASDILDGESWDLAGASIRVGGDGDPITALYPWFGNNLLVFKQRSIWLVNADPLVNPAFWTINLINNRVGCVAYRSIQSVGADVYFLAQDGVRSISQIQAGSQTDVGQPLSAPVQDVIDSIHKSAFAYITSAYYRNRYFLVIPTDSAATAGGVLVWNELSKSWLGMWTGWMPREFLVTGFSGRLRLNLANQAGAGGFQTWDDYTPVSSDTTVQYQDVSTKYKYESYVVTRAYDMGDPLVDKLLHTVQIATENRIAGTTMQAYLAYSKDLSGVWSDIDSNIGIAASDRQKRRTCNLLSHGKCNLVQFQFGASKWKTSLTSIAVTAFPDPMRPELGLDHVTGGTSNVTHSVPTGDTFSDTDTTTGTGGSSEFSGDFS